MQQRWFWAFCMAMIFGLMFMKSNIVMIIFMILIGGAIGYFTGVEVEKHKKPPKE